MNRQWLTRYMLALAGPLGTAVAQFIFSLQLLHTLDTAEFGAFAFLLVTSQLSLGVWGALFCAPIAFLIAGFARGEVEQKTLDSVYASNLVLSLVAIPVFGTAGYGMGIPFLTAVTFGFFVCISLLRWLARQVAYAEGEQLKSTVSDSMVSFVLFAGIVAFHFNGQVTLQSVFLIQLAGVVLGFLPFGRRYLIRQFINVSLGTVPIYRSIWVQHSKWSLAGVLTTEATANAHAYIVTLLAGPAAFAPLAATTLIIRPISVVSNALAEFERSRMTIDLGQRKWVQANAGRLGLRLLLALAWLGMVGATISLFAYDPFLLFPKSFPLTDLQLGAALWLAIAGMRLVRTPESALLQAAGRFRPLAYASFASCGISVAAATILLLMSSPLVSLLGVLLGEGIFALGIWYQVALFLRSAPSEFSPREEMAPSAAMHPVVDVAHATAALPRYKAASAVSIQKVEGNVDSAPFKEDDSLERKSETLLLVSHVAIRQGPRGPQIDNQTAAGISQWCRHFDKVTYYGIADNSRESASSTAWVDIIDIAPPERCELIALPPSYSPLKMLKQYRRVRGKLRAAISMHRHLCFTIGSLIGDWPSVAAHEAIRQKRPFAAWIDRVEPLVIRNRMTGASGLKRLYWTAVLPLMDWNIRNILGKSAVALLQGGDTFEHFAKFSKDPHCTYDTHTHVADQITPEALLGKQARVRDGSLINIIYVGRAAAMKGPMDWLETLERIHQQGVAFRATWIGDGPELTRIKAHAEASAFASSMHLPGFQGDREALLQAMRDSDLMLYCHKTPESPRCLIEALVSGCPLVGYETAYPRGLVAEEGGGLFAPQDDVAALSDRIMHLHRDREAFAGLIGDAARSGEAYNEDAVYAHRANLMKRAAVSVTVA